MKLKENFIVHISNNEAVLVPSGKAEFSGIVKGNATFGEILKLLETEVTECDIVNSMEQRFDAPRVTIEEHVQKVIERLRGIGAIDE